MSNTSDEIRTLVLRSYDINSSNSAATYFSATGAPVVTPAGTVADNRMTMTWNNVNLRQMMGDTFYNKFDKFHIRLNTFMIGQNPTSVIATQTVATADARSVDIYMLGLPWDPAPYNQGSSTKSAGRVQIMSTVLPILPTTAGLGVGQSINYGYGQSPSHTFSKTADSPTITIQMVTASTQTAYIPASNVLLYGHCDFIFEIHGLVDEETKTTRDNNLMATKIENHRHKPESDCNNEIIFT
jgi:hypothetical protein